MLRGITDNLDFLAARVHGRRRQMAEDDRLETLCRLGTIPQFAAAVMSGVQTESVVEIQRRLVQDLAQEIVHLALELASAGAELLRWLAVGFQVENLKVAVRGLLTGLGRNSWQPHLVPLPREFALDAEAIAAAKSVQELVHLLPRGPLRHGLAEAVSLYREASPPFFFEARLDQAYFEELLVRAEALTSEDEELVKPLVLHEIDAFHLLLVARGKGGYRLEAKALLPLHVAGTNMPRERFAAMLADPDLRTAATRALGRALDELPRAAEEPGNGSGAVAPAELEALAWKRFQRLANRAFRRSHMGLAAVVAYVGLRRVEVANLITLCEAIRTHVPAEQARTRLIPRQKLGVAHA